MHLSVISRKYDKQTYLSLYFIFFSTWRRDQRSYKWDFIEESLENKMFWYKYSCIIFLPNLTYPTFFGMAQALNVSRYPFIKIAPPAPLAENTISYETAKCEIWMHCNLYWYLWWPFILQYPCHLIYNIYKDIETTGMIVTTCSFSSEVRNILLVS